MNRIYFDNAATTALDNEVLAEMMPYLSEKFGNPSSIYSYGRETKQAIENARKKIAKILNADPGEITFTSGGTESTNTAINAAINDLGCTHVISSPIEHPATLRNVEYLGNSGKARVSWVKLTNNGHIDLNDLEQLLANATEKTLVTLMHANNEIGNLLDLKAASEICSKYHAIFHSDMVQTVAHYPIDLRNTYIHFISGSGHKFHGPKGIGILFVRNDKHIQPLIRGGSQERNMRGGTENLYGIVGFGKALELADSRMHSDSEYIQGIKSYMTQQLKAHFPNITLNGDVEGRSLYTVINASFPKSDKTDMLLFNLDMAGVCVSGGSACSSGASSVSHVIKALHKEAANEHVPIRFSFSRHSTKQEVDQVIDILKKSI
jgi:cysteine desulfurase